MIEGKTLSFVDEAPIKLTYSAMSAVPSLSTNTGSVLALSVAVTALIARSLIAYRAGPAIIAAADTFSADAVWSAIQ